MAVKKRTELTAKDFVHLHNHTQYSLLDGLTKIPELTVSVKKMGMESVAITDHGTLSGAIEFYKEARSNDIRPIIGIETYVAARSLYDRDPSKDKPNYHLILLAMNEVGYQNLMAISTIANLEGFYYRPRIDRELISKHNEGLIALSGCIGGEVGDLLRQGQFDAAKDVAKWYKTAFGDRYYLELQDHGHPSHPGHWAEQKLVNEQLLRLGSELGISCVLTCDAHYLNHSDQQAHEILLCVQTGSFLTDEKRMSLKEFELHLTDPKDIIKRWGSIHPELITNTRLIAERCNVNIELNKILIPKFPVPKGESEKTYLRKLVWRGLAWRYGNVDLAGSSSLTETAAHKTLSSDIIDRAEYELDIMDSMGFNGYFLIVQDFIGWGKDNGIIFGPGRGSAAGSIVAYALRITEIEPLRYKLMFERFLNPGRISMPDIDIDIQDTRRDEVIKYCVRKYGKDRVANIVTFGRMAARNAVRDVARVLEVPYGDADRLAKMIPPPLQGRHIPLSKSLRDNPELRAEYKTNKTAAKVFDLAVQLEGTIRSHGVHAAGVVIAPEDIVCYTPLEMAQKGVIATQYSMGPIEELGLLKMDFLGLSNLTILNNTLRIVRRVYGVQLELNDIDIQDEMTFKLLQNADTTGVFQLESAGMKRYLKQLKPTLFEDIIAMGALYRPGPMSEIPRFIEGKNNPASITFLHSSLEPILGDTYGVMVYQEQIIKLLQLVAGYTPGEADLVRKAIGKKKRDIMKAEEPKFISGCIKQGLSKADAGKLWAQIQPFADYSFNKAHATCYAQISYWTAFLKAHYPKAFMAALMTSDFDDNDRLAIEINECKRMGIAVLAPDVNESFVEFAVVPDTEAIRFGLTAIKNVGLAAVEEILRARGDSPFLSLDDLLKRVNLHIVNRKALESLIKAGALDRFADRFTLLANLDLLLAYSARLQKQASIGQTDLFGALSDDTTYDQPALMLNESLDKGDIRTKLLWERELLGIYLSQHPLEIYESFLSERTVPLASLKPEHDNKSVTIGGAVSDIREITTKNGQKMAFVRLEDRSGELEIILFPSAYQLTAGLWQRDLVVLVRGKVNARDKDGNETNEVKVMVDDAREITIEQVKNYQKTGKKAKLPKAKTANARSEAKSSIDMHSPDISTDANQKTPKRLYIRLNNSGDEVMLSRLKKVIDEHNGMMEVVLVLASASGKQAIKLPGGIDGTSQGVDLLRELMGNVNVKIS